MHVCRREMYAGVWWGNSEERVQLEDLDVDIYTKTDLKETAWVGVDWSPEKKRQAASSCKHNRLSVP